MNFFTLMLLILCIQAKATILRVQGIDFEATKLGSTYFVSPLLIKAELVNRAPKELAVACETIDRLLEGFRRKVEDCNESPSNRQCKALINVLDGTIQTSFAQMSAKRQWDIEPQFNYPNGIERQLAKKLATNESNIKLRRELSLPGVGQSELEVEITKTTSSSRHELVRRFSDSEDNPIYGHQYGTHVITDSLYTACDILDESIQVEVKFDHEISKTEDVSQKVADLGFKIYKKLQQEKIKADETKEIQAAYLGYRIGKVLEQNPSVKLSLGEAFEGMVQVKQESLVLRKFGNRNNFDEQVFPSKSYTARIKQNLIIGE